MKNLFYSQRGSVSRTLIILAVIILIAIAAVYFGTQYAQRNAPEPESESTTDTEPPPPVYETQIGDIRILLVSAINMGDTLYASQSNQGYAQNATTTEKFIKVTIAAQNKGKVATQQYVWGMENILDSEGRVFVNSSNTAYAWLPPNNPCGAVLKPEFEPIVCTAIFEVSRASTKLGVQVWASGAGGGKQVMLLDLPVQ